MLPLGISNNRLSMAWVARFFVFLLLPLFSLTDAANELPQDNSSDESTALFPASQIPVDEPTDKFTGELVNMLITLGFLVAGILALSWVLKRMLNAKVQQENVSSDIKVLERRSLSPKSAVYLIEVSGRQFVVGESAAGLHPLASFSVEEESSEQKTPFEKVLDR